MEACEQNRYHTIEWSMMDKQRFFAFSLANLVTLRSFLYPLTVIKTNLQVQKSHNGLYKGTFDAFFKIVSNEGFKGLYRGFMVNSMQVVSGFAYIVTYEKMRHVCSNFNIQDIILKGLIAGGTSSMVSQTINTPFDVISQHLMLLNKQKQYNRNSNLRPLIIDTRSLSRFQINLAVIKELYRTDGLIGFYRGYFASLATYIPSSICFWIFYPYYSNLLCNHILPKNSSKKPIDLAAGSLSGASVAVCTNALDVIRVNIQVQRITFFKALKTLWINDGIHLFYKGLSARLPQSMISSACIAFGYETVKRYSLKAEYVDKVRM